MNKSAAQGDTTDTRTVATNTTAVEQDVTTGRRTLSAHQRTIVAITFFSMFFGAGNLIFPPYVGALAGNTSLGALVGFIISAVGLPVLAVVAVSKAGGFANMAGRVSRIFAVVLAVAIILTIGPLFAIPRGASTSYEMMVAPFVDADNHVVAQLIYSAVFFILSFIVAQHPEKLSKVLGKVMGPILLIMIAILVIVCFFIHHPAFSAPTGDFKAHQFVTGFLNGYQTMDMLAGAYFGIVISANIGAFGVKNEKKNHHEVAFTGCLAGIMLAVVYGALGFVGAVSGSLFPISPDETGATVLTNLAKSAFGPVGIVFIGIIFVVACFNCCTGLLSTVSSFFHEQFPTVFGKKVSYRAWSVLFTVVAFIISNAGLSLIIQLAAPILEALYPIAIVLVILTLLHKKFTSHYPRIYFWSVLFTTIVSLCSCILAFVHMAGGSIPPLEHVMSIIPGYGMSLEWILPAFVGAVIGFDLSMFHRNWKRDEEDPHVVAAREAKKQAALDSLMQSGRVIRDGSDEDDETDAGNETDEEAAKDEGVDAPDASQTPDTGGAADTADTADTTATTK